MLECLSETGRGRPIDLRFCKTVGQVVMGIALILIGTLAVIVGPIVVVVNAIRKKPIKPWAIVAGSGILLIIIGSVIIPKTEFVFNSLTVMPKEVVVGEEATVTASIENTGEVEGTYHATLTVNNEIVESKDVLLGAGLKQTISFRITEDDPGIYKVEVGELACTLKVLKPAEFELISLGVNPKVIKVGEEATVTANLKNHGEAGGTYSLSLSIDGEVIETRDVTLAGGVTKPVTFSISQYLPGTYSIEIGSLAGSLKVIQPVRLPTGTYVLGKLGQSYTGDLKVKNGLNLDAVIVLTKNMQWALYRVESGL